MTLINRFACLRKRYFHFLLTFGFFFLICIEGSAQESDQTYRVVDRYGQLRIQNSYILNANNDTVSLEGVSLFWSQWIGKYYNYDCIKWLRDDFHCEVIRAALAVENGGYLKNPEKEKEKIKQVIEACIDLGIYVIVDWHSHEAHKELDKSIAFFSEIAQQYGDRANIIYEIYNEPLRISWDSLIKPYCEQVIVAIRKYDPDNIIIVGTPAWSQDVDVAADNPIRGINLAYALHFYAGTHEQWLRDKADYARGKGLALWVSEFGTCNADGRGNVDYDELALWVNYMEKYKLSWCNWSVADKDETSSIMVRGSKKQGGWTEDKLTESGNWVRTKLRSVNP